MRRAQKFNALLVIAIGLYTFFLPLVTINPPVLGRARWSAMHIAWETWQGKLPEPSGSHLPRFLDFALSYTSLGGIALAYLLLLVALATVFSPGYQKALKLTSLIGLAAVGMAFKFALSDFARLFFGIRRTTVEWNGDIGYGAAMYAILGVMAALLLVSMTAASLDANPSGTGKQMDA